MVTITKYLECVRHRAGQFIYVSHLTLRAVQQGRYPRDKRVLITQAFNFTLLSLL